ncbi:MAG: cytochrome c oxidase accessory protein CcoG, partial [Gemmatimonadota bacterium]|nr:cytochrome c oxidase accessory protein CcoG [Gemmatimonadota bacterium]
FTAVFGRVWCGYACPQTVFLESWIRPIEMWIEGDRTQRKRRDGRGLSWDKAWRKGVKWVLFLGVSFLLAMAMMSIFAGARPLWMGRASFASYALVAILTGFWYLDFTWFREQFCIYLCPYARFQSALTDDETLLVSYDEPRGEPRDKSRGPEGGCIGCQKCVVVCPQGIDIRDGFQLECIQCARCIDACQSVMERFDQPTLVRYSSIATDGGKKHRAFRPRTLTYGMLLTVLTVASTVLLMTRVPFEATVNRAPGSLFQVDQDGYVRNTFLLKISNNAAAREAVTYHVEIDGIEGAELLVQDVSLEGSESRTIPMVVRVSLGTDLQRTVPFHVNVTSSAGELRLATTFKTGVSVGGTE